MHVDLITTTKGNPKVIHGTENGKKTACGINLTKPENIGLYTTQGPMGDVIQMTCEKCKTVIAKRLIKESNKEMAAQLKEEQRMLKMERKASKHHGDSEPVSVPAPSSAPKSSSGSSGSGYIPPSMRKSMQEQQKPIETPSVPKTAPMPAPAPAPAPAPNNDVLSQFAIPTVPSALPNTAPAPAPAPAPVPSKDVLSQFAIPTVPSALPNTAPAPAPAPAPSNDVLSQFAIPTVPTSLPGTAPAPAPAPAPNDDVLSQFAIPTVPTSLPGTAPAPAPAPAPSNDVLSQFAIPTVPTSLPGTAPAPAPAPAPNDDVLSQFAIPTVPTSLPGTAPAPAPAPALNDDVLSQFAIPTVPTSLPGTAPAPAPAPAPASNDDVLSRFAIPTVPTSLPHTAPQDDVLAQFSINPASPDPTDSMQIDLPAADADTNGSNPVSADSIIDVPPAPVPVVKQPAAPPMIDSLDDLMLMPGQSQEPEAAPLPDLSTVPTSLTDAGVPMNQQPAAPTLNVPPVPEMAVPPMAPLPNAAMPQGFVVPQAAAYPQGYPIPQVPIQPGYPQGYVLPVAGYPYAGQPQSNLFAVPSAAKKPEHNTPTPLFVGYSADGRQLFQTYDEKGNPIPINEPVYSAPPETPKNNAPAAQAAGAPVNAAPVMDLDDLMASMGIPDPKKPKADEGKAINYTEYKIPAKKKKNNRSAAKPASAQKTEETGPISAAEAKRRKKVDKINKEFEKQLRSRGIDPKTGGIIMDKK